MNPVLKWLLCEVKAIIYNFLLSPFLANYYCPLHNSFLIYLFLPKRKQIWVHGKYTNEQTKYFGINRIHKDGWIGYHEYISKLYCQPYKKQLRFKGNARKIIASMIHSLSLLPRRKAMKANKLCDQCLLYGQWVMGRDLWSEKGHRVGRQ